MAFSGCMAEQLSMWRRASAIMFKSSNSISKRWHADERRRWVTASRFRNLIGWARFRPRLEKKDVWKWLDWFGLWDHWTCLMKTNNIKYIFNLQRTHCTLALPCKPLAGQMNSESHKYYSEGTRYYNESNGTCIIRCFKCYLLLFLIYFLTLLHFLPLLVYSVMGSKWGMAIGFLSFPRNSRVNAYFVPGFKRQIHFSPSTGRICLPST